MTSFRKKIASLAIVTAMALWGLSACASGDAGNGGSSGGDTTFTLGLPDEPETLDFTSNGNAPLPLLYNVYETLVKVDQSGKVVPLLAKSWETSPDRKTYTFHLVDNAKFSNGKPFTSADAKFSIQRVKTWTDSSKDAMAVVQSVDAPDATTLVVTLSRPSNDWLFKMTSRIGVMFSQDGVSDLANKAIGTGPYIFDNWKHGDSITLTRNASYWGKKAGFKSIVLKFFKDGTAANNALLSGTINAIALIQDTDSLAQFKNNPKYQIIKGTSNLEVVLAMNNSEGPMANKDMRMAVKYGIDHQALLDTCYGGYGTLIGSMVPPTDPWYEDLTGKYPYDPAKAKELLAASGEANQQIKLTVPTLPAYQACGQVLQSQLKQLGFNVKLTVLEFPAVWFKQVFTDGKYDLNITGHSQPHDICDAFKDKTYYTHYGKPAFKDLCDKADAGTPEEQVTYMKQASEMLVDDAAADWLWLMPNLIVADKDITGLPANATSESIDLTGAARS
jgi:peptide/nickel transport system substrate-binding protein